MDCGNKNQLLEVKSIKWCVRNECLSKIRSYDKTKIKIL